MIFDPRCKQEYIRSKIKDAGLKLIALGYSENDLTVDYLGNKIYEVYIDENLLVIEYPLEDCE